MVTVLSQVRSARTRSCCGRVHDGFARVEGCKKRVEEGAVRHPGQTSFENTAAHRAAPSQTKSEYLRSQKGSFARKTLAVTAM